MAFLAGQIMRLGNLGHFRHQILRENIRTTCSRTCCASMAGTLFSCACLLLLLLIPALSQRTPSGGRDEDLMMHLGQEGSALLKSGDTRSAIRAFKTILRWNPGVWQAHHSLGMALLTQCDCAQAFRSLSTALTQLRQGQSSSPATEAHIMHGMVSALLIVAKLTADLSARHKLLESVATLLDNALALAPTNAALAEASNNAKGKGGPWQLLQVSSGSECQEPWRKRGATAMEEGDPSRAAAMYNNARLVNSDSEAAFAWLKTAIVAELSANSRSWPPQRALLATRTIYFSQVGQDQWVFENVLRPAGITRGVFVEAGAVDGVTNSNTLFLERSQGWTGVCLEPSPSAFRELRELRPGCTALNTAISTTREAGEDTFYTGTRGNALCKQRGGLESSLGKEGREKLERDCTEVEKVTVGVKPLGLILAELRITHVDFMSLDLEGAEAAALNGVDWSATTITCLCIEDNEEGGDVVRRLLESKGFELVRSLGQDDIYVDRALVSRLRL